MYSLVTLTELESPDLIFLAEPQIFSSDLHDCMAPLRGDYSWELNSEDKYAEDLPMRKSKAKGGTLVLWKKKLDKYITVHPVNSPSFLPIIYSPPCYPVSAHIGLYLPTSGKESEFFDSLAELSNTIDDITEKYEGCLLFLRGDGNVNSNNLERDKTFSSFISKYSLDQVPIIHKTYHHFLGGGAFDSSIDVILHSKCDELKESVTYIYCKQEHSEIDSHHDAIVSSVTLPVSPQSQPPTDLLTAPKLELMRSKILWSDAGIDNYQKMVSEELSDLRRRWLDPLSKSSLSVLLASTNSLLSRCAMATNQHVDLTAKVSARSEKKPIKIRKSENILRRLYKSHCSPQLISSARTYHRSLVRSFRNRRNSKQDQKLFSILSSTPAPAFKTIKTAKSSTPQQVPFIQVGKKKYIGRKVIDGLYESVSALKSQDTDLFSSSQHHYSLMQDYENIKLLCAAKFSLPPISLAKSSSILRRIKPSVNDIYSITANHLIHAGSAGLVHFNLLLNAFLMNVNNCTVEELNTVYALLLYKGHKKDRTLDSSYRTISTCPLIAKGLDIYIRDLSISHWNSQQASTQYQGEGSSHELASLLVTTAIQHSKYISNKPIYLLFLDAKSAFDGVNIPYLIRNLYLSGMENQGVLFMNHRLTNRRTVLEFDKIMAGPIIDEQGLEQGGVSSSDCYKLYSNELFENVQESKLGVDMGGAVVSCVGQADDAVLLSNDIHKLYHISHPQYLPILLLQVPSTAKQLQDQTVKNTTKQLYRICTPEVW